MNKQSNQTLHMAERAELTKKLSPKKQELLELLLKERKKKADSTPVKPVSDRIARRKKHSPAPLSFAQQRLWFMDQLDPGTPAFNIPAAIRFLGPLDIEALKRCFAEIVSRHETLRTTFASEDGKPMQVIAQSAEYELSIIDLRHLPEDERMNDVQRMITDDCQRSFDLTRCPLMRSTLLLLGERDQVMVLMMHHIIGDVWSIRVIMRELAALYEAYSKGQSSPLPELPIQYADYSIWQRDWLQGEVLQSQLAYWEQKLAGMPEELELPTDYPRPPVQSVWGARHFLNIHRELADASRNLGRAENASLFMTLLAVWKLTLHHFTGQNDIVLGAPVANRNRSEFEGMIGFFVNSIILRTDLGGNPSFRELLRRVREVTLGAFSNQDFPFERLVEALQPARNMSRNPLFQADFILQNAPRSSYHVSGLSFEPLPVETGTAQLDMTLDLVEEGDGIGGWLEYDTDLFSAGTIIRMADHFKRLLECVVAHPDRRLSDYSLLSDAERQQILVAWNQTARPYDPALVHELFERRARSGPDAIALVNGEQQLSYAETDRRANQLANYLRGVGVGPDVLVGLYVDRSMEMVIGLLGVLKAGGAYLPLDASYPQQRLSYILDQARVVLVLTQSRRVEKLSEYEGEIVCLDGQWGEIAGATDEPPQSGVMGENLAYVIYTSGSTGMPKGVMLSQAAVANHNQAFAELCDLVATDRVLQFHSISFDMAVEELYPVWLSGGAVVLRGEELVAPGEDLERLIAGQALTVLNLPTVYWHEWMKEIDQNGQGLPKGLRLVNVGGDKASAQRLESWNKINDGMVRWLNTYGPTEAAVDATAFEAKRNGKARREVPIGKPLPNVRSYILDAGMRPLPVGVVGELYLGGSGLARGYLKQPGLTAEKFVPDPFDQTGGGRLYRTGDLARYLEDGEIEFIGRSDAQVKVRGYRIELREIERALCEQECVRDAVAAAYEAEDGVKRIVGYVAPEREMEDIKAFLRERLRGCIPEYMVPSSIVLMESLPLTPNGKIDRKALPRPEAERSSAEKFIGPRTPTEEVLSAIWSEILGVERIGVEDNFFELGAHSLLVTQVFSRIRKAFKVEPPLRMFFEYPTIRGIARTIDSLRSEGEGVAAPPIVPIPRAGDLPLSFTQERMWFLDQLEPGLIAYNVPGAVYMDGRLITLALEAGLSEIIRRHEIFRTTYSSINGKPIQIINPPRAYQMPIIDLQGLEEDHREALALRLAKENAGRPFDLAHGPVLRCILIRMGIDNHMLAMTTHHIAYDMWAREIFIFELGNLYQTFMKGEPSPLPEPEIQWADYASWQRNWLQGEILEKQLDYWRQKLAGAPTSLDLPIEFPRPPIQSYRGARQYLQLPAELAQDIAALSKKRGITRFILVLAVFKILIQRYCGQDQIVVGSPIANRNRLEVENLMGFLANTLVLYTDLSGNPSFVELLERVRETVLGAHTNQDVPFELLVQALQPQRDMSRSPLFQVMFNYMLGYSSPKVDLPELTLRLERLHSGAAQFEINVDMWETDSGLSGVAEYCTDLFRHATITRFISQFKRLLEEVVADPERRISAYRLLSETEERQLLIEWNETKRPYRLEKAYAALFESQVERTPDRVAAACGGQQISYRELNRRANHLARSFVERRAGPEFLVALLADRGIDFLIAMLAIFKAGGAYLPLDPRHPVQRIAQALNQSRAAFVITAAPYGSLAAEAIASSATENHSMVFFLDELLRELRQEENLSIPFTPNQLAYVIYTSGSTGLPKGAMIEHRGMLNHLFAKIETLRLTEKDIVAQTASQCFDISVWQFLAALLVGGQVRIFDDEIAHNPASLLDQMELQRITILETVPSIMRIMLTEAAHRRVRPDLSAARWLVPTGEALPPDLCRYWFDLYPEIPLLNAYGPTECSDDVTHCPIERDLSDSAMRTPIGRPIANMRIYVLNPELQPQPIGVAGELCVGGEGVGRGYFNEAGKTSELFIPAPFAMEAGRRLYKTGDLARFLPDGNLEYLDRIDHQVKIRGFRIELGEIEAALHEHGAVEQAVVLMREDRPGEKRLVAYVVSTEDGETAIGEMRTHLKQQLPEYMVPSAIVLLESLPLTTNGKIDRKALSRPDDRSQVEMTTAYVEPQSELERTIAAIWSELLGVEKVGLNDDFFDLGGHSLLAIQLLSRIRDRLQVEIAVKTFFESSTVADMAKAVSAIRWAVQSLVDHESATPGEGNNAILEEGVI
jgi:amino acid adenylation domain-containing protein